MRTSRSASFPALLAGLAALSALALIPRPAAGQPAAGEVLQDLQVEVRPADGRDAREALAALTGGSLEVSVGGEIRPAELLAEGAEAEPWQIVFYIDRPLISGASLQRAAVALGALARRATEVGTVEVVLADPEPRTVLPPTRDPSLLDASVSLAALEGDAVDEIRPLRERFFQRIWHESRVTDSGRVESLAALLEEAVAEEVRVLERQQDHLLSFLARTGGPAGAAGKRALVHLTDGYELDPREYYLHQLSEEALVDELRRRPSSTSLPAATDELARALAALGWTVIGMIPERAEEGSSAQGIDAFQQAASSDPLTAQPTWSSTSLERIRRRLRGEDKAPAPRPFAGDGQAPFARIADSTGGAVAATGAQLAEALAGLERRVTVRFTAPAGGHQVAVRFPGVGSRLRSRRWVGSGLPEAVAAARVRRLLGGEPQQGELDVTAAVRFPAPALDAQADLLPLATGDPPRQQTRVRVTVGMGAGGSLSTLVHEEREVSDLPRADRWSFHRELEIPPGVDRVAVLVEDLETGAWGGSLAASLETAEEDAEDEQGGEDPLGALAEAAFLPRPKALQLIGPGDEVLRGRVRFQALVHRGDVARVAFLLDGEPAAEADRAPFVARIQLGRLPRPHTLRAVAYDTVGREVGSDTLAINDGGRSFRVRILHPGPGPAAGPVDVELDLRVPVDRRLDRVEIQWNDRTVATLYGAPYRQRIAIPRSAPTGFVRAVAHLADGRSTEDVVLLNEPDFAERVQIRLVELYTVVTDRQGRPVKGLTADDFSIFERGEPQSIETFDDAGDLPLTLALTVDSSASMFVKLPAVQQAAGDFVRGFLTGRDQALLVDFDTEPRLARELTSDLDRVIDGIDRLEADGDTHLWESIVFSLLELQGVGGKKAVVVFSDGAEEEEELSYRTCFELARRMGIPVYLIVLHPGLARGDDLSPGVKGFTRKLEQLTDAVGGRTYYVPNTRGLGTIYAEIDSELRSQYLLTYYPSTPPEEDGWRSVTVKLANPAFSARTISGYFPDW